MKLYKVEIVAYPESAARYYALVDAAYANLPSGEDADYSDLTGWSPDEWLENESARAEWIARYGNADFYWPSTKRLYQSKSGAQARAALIESYGATVEIVESDEIVWLTSEIRRSREIEALRARLSKLEAPSA